MALPVISGLIGRMFGQGSAPETAVRSKAKMRDLQVVTREGADSVELSPNVPKPLEAETLSAAQAVAKKLLDGGKLTASEVALLREDRVFAAVTALAALSESAGAIRLGWPGGLPAPTSEELAEAYRRLTQRLRNLDAVRDPQTMQELRQKVLTSFRDADWELMAGQIQVQD